MVLSTREPNRIIAARNGSSLILGIGDGEMIIPSNASSIVEHISRGRILAEIGNARLDGLQLTDAELNNCIVDQPLI
jgi:glucosamine--fructose-6-phosphate aminotransferase (isomerizing)